MLPREEFETQNTNFIKAGERMARMSQGDFARMRFANLTFMEKSPIVFVRLAQWMTHLGSSQSELLARLGKFMVTCRCSSSVLIGTTSLKI